MKSRLSNRQTVGPLKNEADEIVSDDSFMASILNKFFTSVFTTETFPLPESSEHDAVEELKDVQFTVETVDSKLKKLKPESACGPDAVTARTLVETADILSVPLALVFTRSLEEGVIPEDWRKANVTPIFKSGSKSSPGNYRPVSLTSIVL